MTLNLAFGSSKTCSVVVRSLGNSPSSTQSSIQSPGVFLDTLDISSVSLWRYRASSQLDPSHPLTPLCQIGRIHDFPLDGEQRDSRSKQPKWRTWNETGWVVISVEAEGCYAPFEPLVTQAKEPATR